MFVAKTSDAVVECADPQCAVAVFENGADVRRWQSISGGVRTELAGAIAQQPASACANPDTAVSRDLDRQNLGSWKAVCVVTHESPVLERGNTVHRADPDLARPVFRDRGDSHR